MTFVLPQMDNCQKNRLCYDFYINGIILEIIPSGGNHAYECERLTLGAHDGVSIDYCVHAGLHGHRIGDFDARIRDIADQ